MVNWSKDLPQIKPKYLAIVQLIKKLIQTDQLLPGQKLPAERSLARWLQVDRSTVNRALEELSAQGLIQKKRGSGTFIANTTQIKPLALNINWQALVDNQRPSENAVREKISQKRLQNPQNLIDAATDELPTELIPDLGIFDFNWQLYLKDQTKTDKAFVPLIKTLIRQQKLQQEIDLSQQSVVISGGAAQSLLLILSSLLRPGDSVAFCRPSYFQSTAVFKTLSIRTYTVSLNHSDFDLSSLENAILKHRIKLLILNPTFQNPTGETLSLSQRQAVISLCQRYQVPIVEDDVFGWLTANGEIPTLKSLSPENVIYLSSMSKLLGSSTRIGWVIAPQAIGLHLANVQQQLDMVPSMLAQEIVNLAVNQDNFSHELTTLTQELTKRRQAVAKIFRKYRPDWQFDEPDGGFYLWVKQSDPNIFDRLLENDILVKPGIIYGAGPGTFRFNVAPLNDQKQKQLIQTLSKNADSFSN